MPTQNIDDYLIFFSAIIKNDKSKKTFYQFVILWWLQNILGRAGFTVVFWNIKTKILNRPKIAGRLPGRRSLGLALKKILLSAAVEREREREREKGDLKEKHSKAIIVLTGDCKIVF